MGHRTDQLSIIPLPDLAGKAQVATGGATSKGDTPQENTSLASRRIYQKWRIETVHGPGRLRTVAMTQ
jgi:hypothetical protein